MSRLRQMVGPVYLFLCIVMGGSAQGVWSNLGLQLAAIGILVWAAMMPTSGAGSRPARRLGWLAAAAVVLVMVQLVPLPPALWSTLPGRDGIMVGFALLGQPMPWMSLSLSAMDTIATAMALLPPLAMLALILRLGAYRGLWLLAAVLLATSISVALGVVQIQSGGEGPYLYPLANLGTASGVFANANHMATLLLVSIPFLAALAVDRWRRLPGSSDRLLTAAGAGGGLLVIVIGIAINHSFALLVIGGPVFAAAALQLVPPGRVPLGRIAAVSGLVLMATAVLFATSMSSGMSQSNRTSMTMRTEIWAHTTQAIEQYGLAGSGVGTFPAVYPLFEDPATVERVYVNHAHNDYLELALEGGVPAVVLMILFLGWWCNRSFSIWRSPNVDDMGRAASIASMAILLHSLVDYPLRTAAIAAIMATAVALMADPVRRKNPPRSDEWRPTRHVTL